MDKTGDFSEQIRSTSNGRPHDSTTENGKLDVVNSLKCCELCDGKIIKKSSKSKSRVWKKVMWFTRKSKTGKQSVCQCDDLLGTEFQRDFKTRASERHSNSWSFTRSASRKFRISSQKRQCKSDIVNKPSHNDASSVHGSCTKLETSNNYRADSPTATGNFCDFGSSCHVSSRAARNTKHASVLTEIARELNPPTVLPLIDLRCQLLDPVSKSLSSSSVSYALHPSVRQSPMSEKGVRRWNSFSGPFTNVSSFKRRNLGPWCKTGGVSSPPLKQKCYGLRRTATFSGKLNTEFVNAQVRKSKSANTADLMKLERASSSMGEIRDQDGSIIGIVHFYKSPKSTCIRRMSSLNHGVKTTITSTPEKVHVPLNVPKNQGSTSNIEIINFDDRVDQQSHKSISEEDQTFSQESMSNACLLEEAVFVNSFNNLDILTGLSDLKDLQTSSDAGVTDNGPSTSFLETGMDLSPILCSLDSPSLPSRMVDDEYESCSMILPRNLSVEYLSQSTEDIPVPQCDEAVLESSALIGAEMEEETVCNCLSGCSLSEKVLENIVGNPSPSATVQETGNPIEGVSCGKDENTSLERFLDDKIQLTEIPEISPTQTKQTNDLSKPCTGDKNHFVCENGVSNNMQIRDTPVGKEADPCVPCDCKYILDGGEVCFSESWKEGVLPDGVQQSTPVLASHDAKLGKDALQVLDTSNTSDYASCSDEDLSNQSVRISPWKTAQQAELMNDELELPVPGQVFKMRTELLMGWFDEFNDEQKNIVMKKLLNRCELPQMHLLSVAMENNLHKSCPPNCQDMLVWLPYPVTLKILTYLDPVSLCRCNQVNKAWGKFTNNPLLWQQLTRNPEYQLSESSSRIQYLKYTRPNGKIHWKKVLAERFLLQRNWLNGKYKLRTYQGHNQGIACVQFDDTRIVSGSSDKTIKLWDISSTTCELMLTLEGHSGTVRCLDLNGNRLVSGSTDRTIKVWDLSFASYWAGASCKVTMVGHLHTVRCLQADDKKLVSGSYDKTVKVWNLKTGQCQLTLRGHTAAVLCVQFDDQKIVSGSYDKKIKVWDLTEGTCLMTLDGHQDAVTCLNLTHDGMKIITGSLDYSLKFWDLFTGKCYGTLDWITSEGHTAVVRCLQVDSWRIISGGDDKTLKVWELATGQRLLTLRCHSDGVTCMQFNDFAIVSGSYDRTVKLWDFTPKHPYLDASN